MPSLFFDVQEVEETKIGKVNKSGYLYVGRKHKDKEVVWIKLKRLSNSNQDESSVESIEGVEARPQGSIGAGKESVIQSVPIRPEAMFELLPDPVKSPVLS